MSNAELINRLRSDVNNLCGNHSLEAADALAAADKRIAELEDKLVSHAPEAHSVTNADHFKLAERYREAERKLAVAREALTKIAQTIADGEPEDVGGMVRKCFEIIDQTISKTRR